MAVRKCKRNEVGYYALLNKGDDIHVEEQANEQLQVHDEELPEGVYEVERLIQKRRVKVPKNDYIIDLCYIQ